MTYRTLYKLCRFKRQGASMVNVCVFFLAATMIMTQVFFFSTTTSETLAEEAKSVERRFSMGQKLELAFDKLRGDEIDSVSVDPPIAFAKNVGWIVSTPFASFDKAASAWSDDVQQIYIYNLNYTLESLDYVEKGQNTADKWDNVKLPQRIFPPMPPDSNGHYFLVRVISPGQGLGKQLMYQVLVQRNTDTNPYTIKPLTFQEVWYE